MENRQHCGKFQTVGHIFAEVELDLESAVLEGVLVTLDS